MVLLYGRCPLVQLDISPDLVKACRKVTVEHIDNLHTLLSASLKGATIRPGSSNDGNNFRTKRELKVSTVSIFPLVINFCSVNVPRVTISI